MVPGAGFSGDVESDDPGRAADETTGLARDAGIIAAGNVAGRLVGLARDVAKSHTFGAGSAVDALNIALRVPALLYDLFVGGMISSSLVPVFAGHGKDERAALWESLSVLAGLGALAFSLATLALVLLASPIASIMAGGASAEVLDLTARLLRITAPAVLFLGLSGILAGALLALRRFVFPAFATVALNGGMIAITLLLHQRLGVRAMALGLVVGSLLQLGLQWVGLRDARLRLRLSLSHPAVRQVSRLYAPIVLGLLVDILVGRPLTYRLASQAGPGGISWMEYALSISQVPRGVVALGIASAILPVLAEHAAGEGSPGSREPFRSTLARGLRLTLVLVIPAAAGMFFLARPTVALLLEHGNFTPFDTRMTSLALQLYLLGGPFAVVDGLLVYAFYARHDTLTPALIGVGVVIVYAGLAFALMPWLGLFSLMVADGVKLMLHTVASLLLLSRKLDGLGRHGVLRTLILTLVVSAVMSVAVWLSLFGITGLLPADGRWAELVRVALPAGVGLAVYLGLASMLRVEEIPLLYTMVKERMAGNVPHVPHDRPRL